MLGIIAGSGFYSLGSQMKSKIVETDYGEVEVFESVVSGETVVFIPRHGKDHCTPPHKVNYKANVSAFSKLGVEKVISVYSAGILADYEPGDIVFADDFIGLFTPATFFDDFSQGMRHVDFSNPFSSKMQEHLLESASVNKVKLKKGGVIVTTPGPRFETKAEVRFLKTTGANLVSMTSGYEMTLLGEAGFEFASIIVATNYGAGISNKPLDHEEVISEMKNATEKVEKIIADFLKASV
jgi:5'-methylthioadenosine phosphorylase